ncbi:MAG: Rne/Rng family ribonuclease [Spirulinaceae cyanobacterium]
MPKQIIIAEQHQVAAVFWEDQIQELVVATGKQQVSDIYLGIVENVIQGIDAAFINIGDAERNGFIHVTDLGPLRLRRSAGTITDLLAPQQKVLVQVMKEPTGNKGPRLTGNISLPGRYLVLMPYGKGVNLSRRIKNEGERSRLRALAVLIKPAGMGLLVRTEAEGNDEETIMEDLESLQTQWEATQQQANSTRPPTLLNRDDDFIQRVLRDIYTADVNRIVVDSHTGLKRVKQQLMNWSGGKAPEGVLIDHHRERLPVLEYFRVNAAIREALKPRVDLPSGGYVIIEPTEALTVIDVNSGSFTRSATSRETVLWTNCEAATEIAHQLRLRNIGGVIIIDFIDMDSRRDQLKLLEHFNNTLKADKARPQIAQLSELGLVELTRKRQGKNIYELFGETCPTCSGMGHLVKLPGETQQQIPDVTPPVIVNNTIKPVENRSEEIEVLLDLANEEEEQDIDLLNHPSYQEQNTSNNNRRRRRSSRRLNDALGKEEASPKVKRTISLKDPKADLETGYDSSPERIERPQINRISRRDEEPPEEVLVEMSELEQNMYALMGISPKVRVDRDGKDSKSLIVSVKLPGEVEQETDESNDSEEERVVTTDASEEETIVEGNQSNGEDNDVKEEPKVEPEVENNDRPVIRRRRRRSSAVVSNSSE